MERAGEREREGRPVGPGASLAPSPPPHTTPPHTTPPQLSTRPSFIPPLPILPPIPNLPTSFNPQIILTPATSIASCKKIGVNESELRSGDRSIGVYTEANTAAELSPVIVVFLLVASLFAASHLSPLSPLCPCSPLLGLGGLPKALSISSCPNGTCGPSKPFSTTTSEASRVNVCR